MSINKKNNNCEFAIETFPPLAIECWSSLSRLADRGEPELVDEWVKLSNRDGDGAESDLQTSSISTTSLVKEDTDLTIEEILQNPVIDVVAIKKHAWRGLPSKFRGLCWKLMMGYLPADSSKHAEVKEKRLKGYKQCLSWPETHHEEQQIKLDVPRTAPQCPLTPLFKEPEIRGCLERILVAYARTHSVGYIQGMNDLAATVFWVFLFSEGVTDSVPPAELLEQVEADTYWCFCVLIDNAKGLFYDFGPGLNRVIHKMENLLKIQDSETFKILQDAGCDGMLFGVRWVVCLLTRDFSGDAVARLWDGYISYGDGFLHMHAYVCAALLGLEKWKQEIKSVDFDNILPWILHLPINLLTKDEVNTVLVKAYKLVCVDTLLALAPQIISVIYVIILSITLLVSCCYITLEVLLLIKKMM